MGRWLKFFIAILLLPLLAAEMWLMVDLAQASLAAERWQAGWFVNFCSGFGAWLLIFLILPRAMWLYVLGHELTHAWAVMLAGGKVSGFHVSSQGGLVVTNRVNWWIALSPYFVPLYALIWACLWITIDYFYYPLGQWDAVLFFGLGLFWAFHLTFTISMLHPRQTDLSHEGYVFSAVIILMFNLLTVLLLLVPLARDITVAKAGQLFLLHARACYLGTWALLCRAYFWLVETLQEKPAVTNHPF